MWHGKVRYGMVWYGMVRSGTWAGEAVTPVPMAHTGSYATTTLDQSPSSRAFSNAAMWSPSTSCYVPNTRQHVLTHHINVGGAQGIRRIMSRSAGSETIKDVLTHNIRVSGSAPGKTARHFDMSYIKVNGGQNSTGKTFWHFDMLTNLYREVQTKKRKNVSCEYDRWVVETQLCKLRDTSEKNQYWPRQLLIPQYTW